MKLARKVAVLAVVPLLTVVALAGVVLTQSVGEAVHADRLRLLVIAGSAAGEVAAGLQAERLAAVDALVARPPGAVDSFLEAATASDAAVVRFRRAAAHVESPPSGVAALLDRVGRQLDRLADLRQRVVSGKGAATAVMFSYRILIADLVGVRESIAQTGGASAEVGDRLRGGAALSRAAEAVALQQVEVLHAAGGGELTPAASQRITAARTGYTEAALQFDTLATEQWRAWLEQALTGAEVVAAQRLEDAVARLQPGDQVAVDRVRWRAAVAARIDRLHQVERRVDTDIAGTVTGVRDRQWWIAGSVAAGVGVALCLLVGLAVWLGRPTVRGLRRLRDAAHQVAFYELPAAVSSLQDQKRLLGEVTPQQIADDLPAPIAIRGSDELAEVGAAFNASYRAAVRVAAEQAMLRVSIRAMLVTLARRGQQLADRLAAELDRVERDEQDPERLETLFRLDHLATLLTGTSQSLLVLGGESSARPRLRDEQLADVVRAAQSQIEQYIRVELTAVDDTASIRASAVDDVVKLLAELMDNACKYSPPVRSLDGEPRPDVCVYARPLADRAVIQIIDDGIGIDEQRRRDLNERLASRPVLDLTALHAMGLTVVAELAARHGIRVELRPGAVKGTIAEVILPTSVLHTPTTHADPAADGYPLALVAASTRRAAALPSSATDDTAVITPAAPLFRTPRHRAPQPRRPDHDDPLHTTRPSDLDATVELPPIFEQVASQWFTPTTTTAADGGAVWRPEIDDGWRAAQAAQEPPVAGVTSSGLPKRTPKAQLVPGGVQRQAAPVAAVRDPAATAATWAAYGRGLARQRNSSGI